MIEVLKRKAPDFADFWNNHSQKSRTYTDVVSVLTIAVDEIVKQLISDSYAFSCCQYTWNDPYKNMYDMN